MNPAEDYILNQPEPYRSVLMHLKMLIEHTIPHVELKYKWRIPCYYTGKKPICYLNASHKHGYVDVGIWHSAHLTKFDEYLVSEKRKVVKSLRYRSLEDIDDDIFISVIKIVDSYEVQGFYKK